MTRRLIIRPEAEADISDAALWYESQQKGLGENFLAEVRAAIDRAVANPRQYRRLRRRPEVRRVLTRRFPYRVFFILREERLSCFASCTGLGTIVIGNKPHLSKSRANKKPRSFLRTGAL